MITKLFPGAMSAATFYTHCREGGVVITQQEAREMRDAWIGAFKEMQLHTNPQRAKNKDMFFKHYGGGDEEEEDTGPRYVATTITGMVRNNCSYNSACNVQFQGPTAHGAKEALWNVYKAGYGKNMLQFVHDELIYWLYPKDVRATIPIIEECMLSGMRTVVKHVKIGVESSLMLHWDKGAKEMSEIQWTDDGLPILEEPEFVKRILE